MDTLATSVIELKDGKLTRYPGNYSYYISKVGDPFAKSQSQHRRHPKPVKGNLKRTANERKLSGEIDCTGF